MKLSDLKDIDVHTLTNEQIQQIHPFLKRTFNKSAKTFAERGLEPEPLRNAKDRLAEVRDLGLTGMSKMQAEVAAMRNFYFTRPRGSSTEQRTITGTVKGYRQYLTETGRRLGIENYATNEWTEDQRRDLWSIIDRVRENGGDMFSSAREVSNTLYQSGTSFEQISMLVERFDVTDPVQVLDMMRQRIEMREAGGTMTDEEFYGSLLD